MAADLSTDPGPGLGADLGWPEVMSLVGDAATVIAADGCPDAIVGVLRGGMIPAVILAHALGLRDVRGVEVTRTQADGPNAAKLAQPQVRNPGSLGVLTALDVVVVDDVAGTGDTIAVAARSVRAAGARRVRTLACAVNVLNQRDRDPMLVTHVGCEIRGWVRFPWEAR